jgi:hypothetical protein
MLAIVPRVLQLLLVMALVLSLGFAQNIVLISLSLLVVVLPSFPQLTSVMHNCLISSGKVDTAVDVAKSLRNITNQHLHAQTVRRGLSLAGMKAVVKRKKPFLSKKHKKARMDFALAHQHWTVEDWKKVV